MMVSDFYISPRSELLHKQFICQISQISTIFFLGMIPKNDLFIKKNYSTLRNDI